MKGNKNSYTLWYHAERNTFGISRPKEKFHVFIIDNFDPCMYRRFEQYSYGGVGTAEKSGCMGAASYGWRVISRREDFSGEEK